MFKNIKTFLGGQRGDLALIFIQSQKKCKKNEKINFAAQYLSLYFFNLYDSKRFQKKKHFFKIQYLSVEIFEVVKVSKF